MTTAYDSEEVPHALFIASLPSLYTPAHLNVPLSHAASRASKRLTVVLLSPHFAGGAPLALRTPGAAPAGHAHTHSWTAVQRLLAWAYVRASGAAHARGRVLLDVDVLLRAPHATTLALGDDKVDCVFGVAGDELSDLPSELQSVPFIALESGQRTSQSIEDLPADESGLPPLFPVVALGGTFDHLHAGHKILLSMAAWITSWKLIVGVTEDALLQKKANKHLIELLPERCARVRAFVDRFRPGLVLDVVPIADVAGPTAWDTNVQALVISRETQAGAAAIDKIRQEKGLPPLVPFVIDVISATEDSLDGDEAALKNAKMSSTAIRQWIADNESREVSRS